MTTVRQRAQARTRRRREASEKLLSIANNVACLGPLGYCLAAEIRKAVCLARNHFFVRDETSCRTCGWSRP